MLTSDSSLLSARRAKVWVMGASCTEIKCDYERGVTARRGTMSDENVQRYPQSFSCSL